MSFKMLNLKKPETIEEKIAYLKKYILSNQLQRHFIQMAKFYHPIGKNVTVRILIGPYGSHTDGTNIQISVSEYIVDKLTLPEIYQYIKSIFIHELEHNISSDFTIFKEFLEELGQHYHKTYKVSVNFGKKVGKAIMNGTEDGRIERIAGQRVSKYADLLRNSNLLIWNIQPLTPFHDELQVFLHQIVSWAVADTYQKDLHLFYDETSDLVQTIESIRPIIEKIKFTNNAKEVKPLCWEIANAIEPYIADKIQENKDKAEQSMQDMSESSDYTGGQGEDFEQEPQQGSGSQFSPDDFKEDGGEKDKKKQKSSKGEKGEEEDKEGQGGSGSESDEENEEENENGSSGSKSDEEGDEEENSSDSKDGEDESAGEDGEDSDESKDKDGKDSKGKDKSKRNNQKQQEQKNKPSAYDYDTDEGESLTPEQIQAEIEKEIAANKKRVEEENRKEMKSIESKVNKDEKIAQKENGTVLDEKEINKIIDKHYKNDYNKKFNQVRRKNFASFVNKKMPKELLAEARKYQRQIEALLEEETEVLGGQEEGLLDSKRLHRLAGGSKAVFKTNENPQLNTAAKFLLDGSGSMYGYPEEELRKMMSVFEEIFIEACEMSIEIFSTVGDGVVHHVVKEWEDEAKPNYNYSYNGLYARRAGGGNKDGYSIRMAAKDLEQRDADRKLLFVLSDGLPSCYSGGSRTGMADVREAVREARKNNIIVIPIMFGDANFLSRNFDAFKEMYQKNIIAVPREQILKRLIKIMQKALS